MRLCFFGDSFVAGAGDDAALGWPGRLTAWARRAGVDVTAYNLGVRRDTSSDIAARWGAEAVARLPADFERRLAFSFGANDCVLDEMVRLASRMSKRSRTRNPFCRKREASRRR